MGIWTIYYNYHSLPFSLFIHLFLLFLLLLAMEEVFLRITHGDSNRENFGGSGGKHPYISISILYLSILYLYLQYIYQQLISLGFFEGNANKQQLNVCIEGKAGNVLGFVLVDDGAKALDVRYLTITNL